MERLGGSTQEQPQLSGPFFATQGSQVIQSELDTLAKLKHVSVKEYSTLGMGTDLTEIM